MISLYSNIGFVLHPIIKGFLYGRMLLSKEDRTRINERFGKNKIPRPNGILIHIHAVSVGEAMSVKILFDLIKRAIPGSHILLTTSTVASAKLLEKQLPAHVTHQYYPIDTPQSVNRFIEHWNPDLAIWVESEIWPLMLYQLRMNGTPIVLLNGRMSERSYAKWSKFKSFANEVFSNFDLVLTKGQEKLDRFKGFGVGQVKSFSSLKLLADPLNSDLDEYDRMLRAIDGRKVWLAASIHDGEDELVIDTHLELLKHNPNALLFIAPRHMTRLPSIMERLQSANLSFGIYSKDKIPSDKNSFFIMDQMGHMGLLYKLSPVTFVGGTYVPKGGHNPIEAAQLGSFVLHGPHTVNNQELYDELHNHSLAEKIHTQDDLLQKLLKITPINSIDWNGLRQTKLDDLEEIFRGYAKKLRGINV